MGELRAHVAIQELQAARLEPLDVLIECIHEHPEGQVTLQLRCAAREHELATLNGATRELGEQTGLADAGLSHQLDHGRSALSEVGKSVIEPTELLGAMSPGRQRSRLDPMSRYL